MALLNTEGVLKVPSSFTHMFKKTNIESITYEFCAKPSLFRNDKHHKATVRMKVDDTTSTQKFFSDDMDDLVNQVTNFVNNLQ